MNDQATADADASAAFGLSADAATEDDELDRSRYVDALAEVAVGAETPLVVALYGAWGSGKTSLMLRLRRQLEPNHDRSRLAEASAARARTIWFDPWMHQFDESPAIGLLHATTDQLELTMRSDVRDALVKIALALAEDIQIPYLGLRVGRLVKVRDELAEDEFRRREQQARLRKHFHDVLKAAARDAPDRRLVFFIDDLDRCQPQRALQVLEALKLYLDLPGCVYVLGVDRVQLEAAVQNEYKELGIAASSYLDKIVQLPFSIPAISDDAMREFVDARVPADLKMCSELLVTAGADDPRQVKRIVNSLRLNDRLWPAGSRAEYQPQILTAIILIQNLAPDLYRELRLNPSALSGLFGDRASADGSLWADHVAPQPRLAAALRLVTVPSELDPRPYFTLTAAVATPPEAPMPPTVPSGDVHGIEVEGLPRLEIEGSGEIDSLVLTARSLLRLPPERFEVSGTGMALEVLQRELPNFALVGHRIFAEIGVTLADDTREALRTLTTVVPTTISVRAPAGRGSTLPAAIFYDHPIDPGAGVADLHLCPAFQEALIGGTPLTTTPCWEGACPVLEDERSVCPSGFWGFRHALGHLLSSTSVSAATSAEYVGDIAAVLGIESDLRADEHAKRLQAAWPSAIWSIARDRETLLKLLRGVEPQLVYLFCDGGIVEGVPWLRLGDHTEQIHTADLRESNWARTRPIVVVSSGLDGDGSMEFARAFLSSGAVGVVATEVPMTEPFAAPFGESLVSRLAGGEPVGWAVRNARLDLLQIGNPLGLGFTPFSRPEVRLMQSQIDADSAVV